jgi:Na+/H+ antiporter
MHSFLPLVLCLVLVTVFLTILANKLKIAYPILLVVAGLTISFIPGLPIIRIDPDLIFLIFLPPLLFEAAWNVSFKEMLKWWRIITSFAFLVVFFTAFLVAIVANHMIPGISVALGFVLGGIVSPPDAVSTGAITKFVKIPKSTAAILEGESLLNDASSLIIFRFALAAVGTGQFIWQEASVDFLWMVFGGAGIGLIIAYVFMKLHKFLKAEAPADIALTLVEPYFMYYLAEKMHASGVLAVVAGGLFLSRHLTFLSSSSRIKGVSVWESFVFLLNGFVFLIIGLELPDIMDGMRSEGIPISTAIYYGVIITIVLILTRMVSSYAALISTMLFRKDVAQNMQIKKRTTWLTPLALGWTGMRGVVSLAAALSIPLTLNGAPFPHRDLILFITFVAILLTLVVQGLTLPYIIKKLDPFAALQNMQHNEDESRKVIKHELKQHVYEHITLKYGGGVDHGHLGTEKILRHWEDQVKNQDVKWIDDTTKAILMDIFEVQRNYLHELNKQKHIDEEIIRHQIYQIDLEEERLRHL